MHIETPVYANNYNFARSNEFFELANHLGNVLVTVSDKKLGVDANNDGNVEYYNPDVISAQDYYPFGQLQPGRQYGAKGKYLFSPLLVFAKDNTPNAEVGVFHQPNW